MKELRHYLPMQLREDQHKAVTYEGLLLMKEGYAANTPDEKAKYRARAEAFATALPEHRMFGRPSYIEVHSSYRHSVASLDKIQFT